LEIENFYKMVFIARKVEVPLFWDKIRKTREVFGLSKSKIAKSLNAPEKYIDYLEAGEIDLLPPEVYIKGFLRRYAKLLNIDEKEIILEYEREINVANHLKKQEKKSLPVIRFPRLIITPGIFAIVFAVLAFLGVAGYFYYELHFIVSPPELQVFSPQNDFRSENRSLEISGATDIESRLTINGQEVYIDKNGEFKESLNLVSGINAIQIKSINRFGKESLVERKVLFEEKEDEALPIAPASILNSSIQGNATSSREQSKEETKNQEDNSNLN